MSRSQYVALFETGKKGANYFRFAYLEYDDGLIPPPKVSVHGVEYTYSPNQYTTALIFKTTQQNVSRWMKNKKPLASPGDSNLKGKDN